MFSKINIYILKKKIYWASALRAFIALRKNILFRYFIEYTIYKDFLKDITKVDILISLKFKIFA